MPETITPITQRFAYVSLGVPDLEAAVDFFRTIGHLSVSERSADVVYLTGSTDHHWIRLHQSDQAGVYRLGYEVVDADALSTLRERLDARGIAYTEFGDIATDRISEGIRFCDPDGVEFDCFIQMVELPFAPSHSIANLKDILHAVWLVGDTQDGLAFYQDVLGFRTSDWIERRMVFMRSANNYHHSAGCGGAGPMGGRLDHIAILVDSLDDVMRIRNYGIAMGANIRQDICRHAASGSMGVYFVEPQTGIGLEFCTGHGLIEDPDHRARIMPASPVTADIWLEGPPADVLGA